MVVEGSLGGVQGDRQQDVHEDAAAGASDDPGEVSGAHFPYLAAGLTELFNISNEHGTAILI
jgi:hypothetical protein